MRRRLPRKLWTARRKRFCAYGPLLPRQRSYGTKWLLSRVITRRAFKLILQKNKRLRKVVRRRIFSQRYALVTSPYCFRRPLFVKNLESSYAPVTHGAYRRTAPKARLFVRTVLRAGK